MTTFGTSGWEPMLGWFPVGTRSSPWTAMLVGDGAPPTCRGGGGATTATEARSAASSLRPRGRSRPVARPGAATTGGIGISPLRLREARRRVNRPTRCSLSPSSSPPCSPFSGSGVGTAGSTGPGPVPGPAPAVSPGRTHSSPRPRRRWPRPVVGRSMALRRMMPMSSRRVIVRSESKTRKGLSSRTSPRQRCPSNSRITGTTSAGIVSSRRATRSASCTNRDWAWPMFLVACEKSRRNRSQSSSKSSPPGSD